MADSAEQSDDHVVAVDVEKELGAPSDVEQLIIRQVEVGLVTWSCRARGGLFFVTSARCLLLALSWMLSN